MRSLANLMTELDERAIAANVGIKHDQARSQYPLRSITVRSWDEFIGIIADYYSKHFSICNSIGGSFSRPEAAQRAREIIEKEYRNKGRTINSAYNDAHEGTNGGMSAILDIIANNLKMESIQRYVQDTFDRYVTPISWSEKVSLISQFIDHCGLHHNSSIDRNNPERYAHDYKDLIWAYAQQLKQTSYILRRY